MGVAVAGEVTDNGVARVAVARAAHLAARAAVGLQADNEHTARGERSGYERGREGWVCERWREREKGKGWYVVGTWSIRRRGAEVGLRHARARCAEERSGIKNIFARIVAPGSRTWTMLLCACTRARQRPSAWKRSISQTRARVHTRMLHTTLPPRTHLTVGARGRGRAGGGPRGGARGGAGGRAGTRARCFLAGGGGAGAVGGLAVPLVAARAPVRLGRGRAVLVGRGGGNDAAEEEGASM